MASNIGHKKINLALQQLHLKKLFPSSKTHIQRNCLVWEADIRPTVLSQIYNVRLTYKLGGHPRINVLKPEAIIPENRCLPHTYQENLLCLYYPGSTEWRGDMLLSNTIVPWISEWLLYYEIWLATGDWFGGGTHPKKHL